MSVECAVKSVIQDVRYATRRLAKGGAFTAITVLTLAIGIGVTTAVFSVVDGVLLRPLPYPHSDRLVAIAERGKDGGDIPVAAANFVDWRDRVPEVRSMAVYAVGRSTVLGGDEPTRVRAAVVSGEFFRTLGVIPKLGRVFSSAETRPGGAPLAVVSEAFWRNELRGRPDLSRQRLSMNGTVYSLVGVMPAGFQFPEQAEIWTSETLAEPGGRSGHNWRVVGRLQDRAEIGAAQVRFDRVFQELKTQYGSDIDASGVTIQPLRDALFSNARKPLLLLLAASALVLLVACTNVASGLLAAGEARSAEMAVRAALGATRWRVVRQLFVEGIMLAVAGAGVGLFLASANLALLLRLAPEGALPRTGQFGINWRILVFAFAAGLISALISTVYPALRTSGTRIGPSLATRGASRVRGRAWSFLIASEVALALLLLVGSGLLIRSFSALLRVEHGFRSDGVLTVDLELPASSYQDDAALAAFYRQLIPDLKAIPGVAAVGVVNHLPLTGPSLSGAFELDGRGPQSGYADYRVATGGFFSSLAIPLRRGRLFDENIDREGAQDVALINESLANRYWPGQDPVGQRIRNLTNDSFRYGEDRWLTIVGVVGDVRDASLAQPAAPTVYVNAFQRPFRSRYAYLTLRSAQSPGDLTNAVRTRVRQLGPTVPMEVQPLTSRIAVSTADRRFSTSVLSFFAGVALLLAAIGIYGVVSYQVVQRSREIAIRMALGAHAAQVRRLIVWGAMRMVFLGLGVGIVATAALTRVVQAFLYGVPATDPTTYLIVLPLLASVALFATAFPAWRASAADPMPLLRVE
jgi:putative ABC transport system permease protein